MSDLYWNFRDNIWYDPSGEPASLLAYTRLIAI